MQLHKFFDLYRNMQDGVSSHYVSFLEITAVISSSIHRWSVYVFARLVGDVNIPQTIGQLLKVREMTFHRLEQPWCYTCTCYSEAVHPYNTRGIIDTILTYLEVKYPLFPNKSA